MRKGISLTVLVITIVVFAILTAIVINEVTNRNLVGKAEDATLLMDWVTFQNELDATKGNKQIFNYTFDENSINASWIGINQANIKTWIPSFAGKYSDKIEIVAGEMVYVGDNASDIEVLVNAGYAEKIYGIPEGYTRVQYLESNGGQYIDTGFVPDINSRIITEFEITQIDDETYGAIFGTRNTESNESDGFANSYNSLRSAIMFGSEERISTYNINQRYILNLSRNGLYLDDVLTYSEFSGTVDCIYNLLLFARNRDDGVSSFGKLKMYDCKIYDNGEIVRRFLPCKRNSDNKPGLYDNITGEFYQNARNGSFVAGPEL